MKNTILVLVLMLFCGVSAEAKKGKDAKKEVVTWSDEEITAKLKGHIYADTRHERLSGTNIYPQPLVSLNVNASMDFRLNDNVVIVKVDRLPVGVNSPESQSYISHFSQTYLYEVKDGQLVIDNLATYKIQNRNGELFILGCPGYSYPLRIKK